MNTSGIDPALAVQEANQSDLVRRKLDMDALRKRLGDQATKEEKLRDACEGFEAVFLQKMWEQMRKNVPKEGYLHSKDEEMYQSLFDIELCKKMASAGGIGLADMLYTQLSQQLENTGRTTTPSTYRRPLDIEASQSLLAAAPPQESPAAKPQAPLTAEELYSPLPDENAAAPEDESLYGALDALKAEISASPAVREWAEARDADSGVTAATPASPAAATAAATPVAATAAATPATPATPAAAKRVAATAAPAAAAGSAKNDPALASWQGPGPVSAKPKSTHLFGRDKAAAKAKAEEAAAKPPAPPRGMAPTGTLWPLADEQANVVSRFGWEDDPSSGKRRWNAGVKIEAAPAAPVRAVLPGTVVYAGPREGYGHTVVLEHKDGYRSYYGNLQPGGVKVGDSVRAGAEFAKIAAEPLSAAQGENSASLHFELKKGEMALNPESAINRPAASG